MKRAVILATLTLAIAGGFVVTRPETPTPQEDRISITVDGEPVPFTSNEPVETEEAAVETAVEEVKTEQPAEKPAVPNIYQQRAKSLGITDEDFACLMPTIIYHQYINHLSIVKPYVDASLKQYGSVCAGVEAGFFNQRRSFPSSSGERTRIEINTDTQP